MKTWYRHWGKWFVLTLAQSWIISGVFAGPSESLDAIERGDYWTARLQLSTYHDRRNSAFYLAEGLIQHHNDCKDGGPNLIAAFSAYWRALQYFERETPTDARVTREVIENQIQSVEKDIRASLPKPIADSVLQGAKSNFPAARACEDEIVRQRAKAAWDALLAEQRAQERRLAEQKRQQEANHITYEQRCLAIFDDSFQFATQWHIQEVKVLGKTVTKSKFPTLMKKALRHCLHLEVRGPTAEGVVEKVKACVEEVAAGAVVAGVAAEYASAGASGGSGGIAAALATLKIGIPACLSLKAIRNDIVSQITVRLDNRSHWTDWGPAA